MATCSKAQLLIDAVANQFTGVAPDIRDSIIIQLLCEIKGMPCDKATLIASAQSNQFTGVEPRIRDALILQLLCDIFDGGGGGGGDRQVYQGSGDPNGVVTPDNTAIANLYYNTDVPGELWNWSIPGQVWN